MPDQPQVVAFPEIVTPEELAQRLKVKTSWIYEKLRRNSANPPPHFRIGKYLRFDLKKINTWLESLEGKPATPRSRRAKQGSKA